MREKNTLDYYVPVYYYECCSWKWFSKIIVKFCTILDQEMAHSL